jgi:hypothetical protein
VVDTFLTLQIFQKSIADPCIYKRITQDNAIIVGVYVDDIVTTGLPLVSLESFFIGDST